MARFCEHVNEPLDFLKIATFIDALTENEI
jgi:hypothetical protein